MAVRLALSNSSLPDWTVSFRKSAGTLPSCKMRNSTLFTPGWPDSTDGGMTANQFCLTESVAVKKVRVEIDALCVGEHFEKGRPNLPMPRSGIPGLRHIALWHGLEWY